MSRKAGKEIDIERVTFDCACPKCGHETVKTAAFIRKYDQYVCCGCRAIVPVVERREILKALAIGEQVIELSRMLRKPTKAA